MRCRVESGMRIRLAIPLTIFRKDPSHMRFVYALTNRDLCTPLRDTLSLPRMPIHGNDCKDRGEITDFTRSAQLKTRFSRRMALGLTAVGALLLVASPFRAIGAEGGVEGKKESKPLRFVVYGDTRDGHDVHRKLVALIMKQDASMVFQTGDLVHNGNNEAQWKIYDDITGEMRKKLPVYPVRGNHDFGGEFYSERFTAPFTNGSKDYYSLDKENCHFIVLDVDEHTKYGPDSEQYKWLVKDLDAVKGKARHVFVFFHVPPYSIGSHGMNPDIQQNLCPVFAKYGVRIVFNGHDHDYYHTTRSGVTYVVTGGGGAPLYPQDPGKGAIPGDKYEMVNHFCVVDVNGDAVTVQAIRPDSSVIEKFTVTAK